MERRRGSEKKIAGCCKDGGFCLTGGIDKSLG